jgi:hypothetical protein
MKIKYLRLVFLLSFFVSVVTILSCIPKKKYKNCGLVVYKTLFYEPSLKKYIPAEIYGPETKIWYKDSAVIFKIMGVKLPNTTNGIETTKRDVVLMHYIYLDLTKMLFYKYASFSDTAQIVQSYNQLQSDTVLYGVTWKFYERRSIPHTKPFEIIADTMIDGKIFKRVKIIVNRQNDSTQTNTMVAYFDCSRKGNIFQINKGLSDSLGCPMVAVYTLSTADNPITLAAELEFISDKLTYEELKVFDAWEKNVKKYPVNQ